MKYHLPAVIPGNSVFLKQVKKVSLFLIISHILLLNSLSAAPYFWVGGSGNWNDLSHWASSSNGSGFAYVQAPTQNDDVYFDQYSFTAAGQTVTVNVFATCRNIDCTGATNVYSGPVNGPRIVLNNQWDVLGDLVLAANMKSFGGPFPVRFIKDNSTINIDTRAVAFSSSIILDGLSTFQLQSNLTSSSTLVINRGKFISNNYSIALSAIKNYTPASFVNELRLGTSSITLAGIFDPVLNYLYFYSSTPQNANLLVDADSCTINLSNLASVTAPYFSLQNFTINKIVSNVAATVFLNAHAVQPATIRYLKMNAAGKVGFAGRINIVDTLELAPGGQYGVGTSLTFQNTAKLIATGNCNRKIEILTALKTTNGSGGIITKSGGWAGDVISNCIIQGIDFSGGGNISATQCSDLGNNNHIAFVNTPQTYYWVGGTGNWHVGDHWATLSGGVASGCVPGPLDSVVFDANSFSAAGQVVYLNDTLNAWCAGMNWSLATNNPQIRFTITPYNGAGMYINGSLVLKPGMNWNLSGTVNFIAAAAHAITSKGQSFKGDVVVDAPAGTYSLGDSLWIQNGKLYLNAGSLVTNNNNLNTEGFLSSSASSRSLNLGSSYWTIIHKSTLAASPAFSIGGTGTFTLNAGTSSIHIRPVLNAYINNYGLGTGLTWYAFYIENSAFIPSGLSNQLNSINNTFDTLYMERGTNFFGSGNTFKQALQLGQDVFTSNNLYIQTFGPSGKLLQINANCSNTLSLTSFTFKKTGGGSISVSFAKIQNTAASGGTFTATSSFDLGGNTGWTFVAPAPRTVYWVGNSGNWSDITHWSTTSGGPGGACIPNAGDDVFFDANSFTLAGQAVTIDVTNADCKNMSWATATNAPALNGSNATTINIYGSYTFNASAIMNTQSTFVFRGNGANQITSFGKLFKTNVFINTTGSYTLTDNLNVTRALEFDNGTFNSNNKDVTVGFFYSNVAATRTLTMGSSQWVINSTDAFLNAWAVNATNLTLNAATSQITFTQALASTVYFAGGTNAQYNKVVFVAGSNFNITGGNFKTLKLLGNTAVLNSAATAISDTLQLAPGGVYTFEAGSAINFAPAAVILAKGTNTQLITMQSSAAGSHYNFTKASGLICADFMNLYDSWASGGAIFTAGANTIDRGGNNGWDFSPYPAAGNGALTGGIKCYGTPYSLRFDISAGAYPMQIIVKNLNTGKFDTLSNVTSTPVYFTVSPLATNNYRVESVSVMRCDTVVTGPFNTVTVTVPVGTRGVWTNGAANNDWFDCRNWGDGYVPDSTTDVVINIPAINKVNANGAYCKNLTVNAGSALSLVASTASLSIYGTITNSGTVSSGTGKIILAGAITQSLPTNMNTFDSLVIDNRSATGVNINANTTANALVLSRGKLNTGANSLIVASNSPGAVSGHSIASYVNGNLRRSITANGVYDFPLGTTAQYELSQLSLNNITGVNNVTARFNAFATPATDTILSPALIYASVDTAKRLLNYGYWSLTPDAQPTSGNYTVTLFERGYTNPAPQADRYIMVKRPNVAFPWDINLGYHDYSTQTEIAGTVKTVRSVFTSFSDFAIAKLSALYIVPEKLLFFTGRTISAGVNRLSWKATNENELKRYEVQRSTDGSRFSALGTVNSLPVSAGNNQYAFDDKQPGSINYYRLAMVYDDGHIEYSNVVLLNNGIKTTNIQVLTQASADRILIKIEGVTASKELSYHMDDIRGRFIQEGKLKPGNNWVTTLSESKGIYIVKIYDGIEIIHIQKIILR